ncbi:XTP/dITP diphosphatase [Endozoicomonas numazuensis]|uniref:dITP/XTP pyrophosphatase n=1 Tax=Endozoicomonas numazuensis TaxID=1137799 RepID=A0A081NIP7_9GAMM|nr:XTP/dITP diphosphatase [Endozoicomonas numazuensis]KEQ18320.1 nucleoside-triphosphate diphosphatase [Endozoicomonas numazuensis]
MKSLEKKVVLASGNKGKLRELQQMLSGLDFEVLPQSEFNVDSVEETGLTFVENALIKARNAAEISGLAAIADDSGIEVDALNGQPGIYSARFAGEEATDQENNQKLLQRLEGLPREQRTARFHSVLVFMRHAKDPTPLICHGSWEGYILDKPSGDQGFGYDPLFYVPDQNCAAAELSREQKNSVSHRAKAMALLLEQLKQRS